MGNRTSAALALEEVWRPYENCVVLWDQVSGEKLGEAHDDDDDDQVSEGPTPRFGKSGAGTITSVASRTITLALAQRASITGRTTYVIPYTGARGPSEVPIYWELHWQKPNDPHQSLHPLHVQVGTVTSSTQGIGILCESEKIYIQDDDINVKFELKLASEYTRVLMVHDDLRATTLAGESFREGLEEGVEKYKSLQAIRAAALQKAEASTRAAGQDPRCVWMNVKMMRADSGELIEKHKEALFDVALNKQETEEKDLQKAIDAAMQDSPERRFLQ